MPATFATLLKEKRKHDRLTQTALAPKLGVDQTMVSRWERGIDRPWSDKYEVIARYLGMKKSELADLLAGERSALEIRQPGGALTPEDVLRMIAPLGAALAQLTSRVEALEAPTGGQGRAPAPAKPKPTRPRPAKS